MKNNIVVNGIRLDSGSNNKVIPLGNGWEFGIRLGSGNNNKVIPLGNGWEFDLEKKIKRSVL